MSSAANMVSRVTDVSPLRGGVLFVVTDRQAVAEREFVAPRWAGTTAAIHRVVINADAASWGEGTR